MLAFVFIQILKIRWRLWGQQRSAIKAKSCCSVSGECCTVVFCYKVMAAIWLLSLMGRWDAAQRRIAIRTAFTGPKTHLRRSLRCTTTNSTFTMLLRWNFCQGAARKVLVAATIRRTSSVGENDSWNSGKREPLQPRFIWPALSRPVRCHYPDLQFFSRAPRDSWRSSDDAVQLAPGLLLLTLRVLWLACLSPVVICCWLRGEPHHNCR